jgi:hypothetical protein
MRGALKSGPRRNTNFALLWRGGARRPNPELIDEYGPRGAPVAGEKGYRPYLAQGPTALDGRAPDEVAASLLSRAQRLLDDPELPQYLDPDWVAEWRGYVGVDETDWEAGALADMMGVPSRDGRGARVSEQDRSDYAHRVLELASDLREGGPPGRRYGAKPPHRRAKGDRRPRSRYLQEGWRLPLWAAEAILTDELAGRTKARLVNVAKNEAYAFVKRHHSKLGEGHKLPGGTMYALGVMKGGRLVAVGLAGHSPANWSKDPRHWRTDPKNILELTRIASDGTTLGASSMLAGRMIKLLPRSKRGDPAAPSLFVTFSMVGERGATYKGLKEQGLRPVGLAGGHAPSGTRKGGLGSPELKIRWEAGEAAMPPLWWLLDAEEPSLAVLLPHLLWKGYTGGYKAQSPWGADYVLVRGRKKGRDRWSAYRDAPGEGRTFFGRANTRKEAKALFRDPKRNGTRSKS